MQVATRWQCYVVMRPWMMSLEKEGNRNFLLGLPTWRHASRSSTRFLMGSAENLWQQHRSQPPVCFRNCIQTYFLSPFWGVISSSAYPAVHPASLPWRQLTYNWEQSWFRTFLYFYFGSKYQTGISFRYFGSIFSCLFQLQIFSYLYYVVSYVHAPESLSCRTRRLVAMPGAVRAWL